MKPGQTMHTRSGQKGSLNSASGVQRITISADVAAAPHNADGFIIRAAGAK
jgi:hypothetical protein